MHAGLISCLEMTLGSQMVAMTTGRGRGEGLCVQVPGLCHASYTNKWQVRSTGEPVLPSHVCALPLPPSGPPCTLAIGMTAQC